MKPDQKVYTNEEREAGKALLDTIGWETYLSPSVKAKHNGPYTIVRELCGSDMRLTNLIRTLRAKAGINLRKNVNYGPRSSDSPYVRIHKAEEAIKKLLVELEEHKKIITGALAEVDAERERIQMRLLELDDMAARYRVKK